MKLNRILASGMDMTDAIRAAVDKVMVNLDKYTERFGEAVSADVEVGKTTNHHNKGEIYRAEINVSVPKKGILRAEATDEDLYAAIDKVEESISRELRKLKERFVQESQAGGPKEIDTGSIAGEPPVEELESEFRKGPQDA